MVVWDVAINMGGLSMIVISLPQDIIARGNLRNDWSEWKAMNEYYYHENPVP